MSVKINDLDSSIRGMNQKQILLRDTSLGGIKEAHPEDGPLNPLVGLNFALIGPGTRGIAVAKSWVRSGAWNLVAVSDISIDNLEKAKGLLSDFNCDYYSDNQKIYDRNDIDFVMITTHDAFHAKPAIEAMKAGKNVFLEKPIAPTTEASAEIIKTWRESDVMLIMGHEFRYSLPVLHAAKLIQDGKIGSPKICVTQDSCGRMGNYFRRKRCRTEDSIKSLTMQKGVHYIDVQAMLLNATPEKVYATGGLNKFGGSESNYMRCSICEKQKDCPYDVEKAKYNGVEFPSKDDELCVFADEIDVYDSLTATINYSDGKMGSYTECYFTSEYKSEHRIIGDMGEINIEHKVGLYSKVVLKTLNSTFKEEVVFADDGDHRESDEALSLAISDAVINNKDLHPNGLDGYYAVAVAEAMEKSCKEEKVIRILKPLN